MFYKLFKEKINDWEIIETSSFLDTGKQELIFPDFTFQNTDGKMKDLWEAGGRCL